MDDTVRSAVEGLALVFSWPNILYPLVATLIAMCFSLVPGLSGATLMALAIPLTLSWAPLEVLLVFGALVGGATFMGSVTSILFNIPGRASSAATLLDGHPMALEGKAMTAIACSATASALGSTVGILVLLLLLPFMREAVLLFGPPEMLLLVIWGLTTIAVLARGSVLKGLIMAGLGLLLSFVGYDPRTAELRYTFGVLYLQDGLDLVPVATGLFAIAETIGLMVSPRRSLAAQPSAQVLSGGVWEGIRSVFSHSGLFLRSSLIGTIVGIVPGIGGTVASFIAYGHAVQASAGKPNRFGRGDIRGVIAPEAAVDAKDGGALVPTLAFGIPGGVGTAMLLTALAVHGLTPGREMLTSRLPLAFVLIWSLLLSNWLTSIFGMALVRPLARVTTLRTQVIAPVILILATAGAYAYRGSLGDVVVAYVFALFGYALKRLDWPRPPLLIALVLGSLFESNLQLTMRLQTLGRIDLLSRPILLLLLLLIVWSLVYPLVRQRGGRGVEGTP